MLAASSRNSSVGSRLTTSPPRSAHQSSASRQSPVASRMTKPAPVHRRRGSPTRRTTARSRCAVSAVQRRRAQDVHAASRRRPHAPIDPACGHAARARRRLVTERTHGFTTALVQGEAIRTASCATRCAPSCPPRREPDPLARAKTKRSTSSTERSPHSLVTSGSTWKVGRTRRFRRTFRVD